LSIISRKININKLFLFLTKFIHSIKLGRVAFEGKPEELKGNKPKIKELFL